MNGPLVEQAQRLHPRRPELEQRQRDADRHDRAQHDGRPWRGGEGRGGGQVGLRGQWSFVPIKATVTRSCAAAADRDTTLSPIVSM